LGFKPSNADRARAKADRRERKCARLAGQAYVERPINILPTLHVFRSGGFINPAVISAITQDLQDLHIAVIENDPAPPLIWKMSEGSEAPQNYTITPVIFPEM
jgi:hypothetical protein